MTLLSNRGVFFAFIVSAIAPFSARAGDPKANALLRLFSEACVSSMGQPDKVRAWATEQRLQEVTAPAALGVFVGAGTNGAAWEVPSLLGSFALSIRGITEGCAVWARAADPDDVAAGFKQLMEGVGRPGLDVGVESDTTTSTPVGQARSLVYHVWVSAGKYGYAFSLLTAERAGGAFQASIQVARASKSDSGATHSR
jgi:hypothetical protein